MLCVFKGNVGMILSPIVLFVYNRPWHTKQTIDALEKNNLAEQSELFIYSDAPKSEDIQKDVNEVRSYIKQINSFKKVTIIERDENWGLANSIIDGVTKIVNKYGRIIVLEDDLVTSPYFLQFMNRALNFYRDENQVWHVSGWNYPIDPNDLDDVFLWRGMECWGWATWDNRWKYYEKNTDDLIAAMSKKKINYMNLDKTRNIWQQVLDNKKNKINTWAVYWYACLIQNNKLSINPSKSFIKNIGLDGSGVNCGAIDFQKNTLNQEQEISFVNNIEENQIAVKKIKEFMSLQKKHIIYRVIRKIIKTINNNKK